MRILILIHEYPPIGGGGGRVAQDLCRGLAQQGHEVYVLTARFSDLPAELDDCGVRVLRLNSLRRESFRADLRAMAGYVLASFWQGLKLIRRWKPDVIHVHFAVPAGASAWALSLLTGTPYVLTAHLGDVPGGVPEKTGKWFRWVLPFTQAIWKRAARVVAVSEFTRRLALRHYSVPIEVIPNGVDLWAVDPGEIEVHQPPRVVFAGRFMPQKNPLQIVRSLAALKDLPWECTLVGDGPLRAEVESEIAQSGVQERFKLTGWLTPEEVLGWFQRSDVLFMPSLSEGLPVTGVQGLAIGLGLVLSNAGGNAELVVNGENGFLIEQGDSAGYEHALRSLLSDPKRLLEARLASRRVAQKFELASIIAAYENVLKAAVQAKAGF